MSVPGMLFFVQGVGLSQEVDHLTDNSQLRRPERDRPSPSPSCRYMGPGSQTGSDIIQRPTPLTVVGMTDTCLWKYYLPTNSLAGGNYNYFVLWKWWPETSQMVRAHIVPRTPSWVWVPPMHWKIHGSKSFVWNAGHQEVSWCCTRQNREIHCTSVTKHKSKELTLTLKPTNVHHQNKAISGPTQRTYVLQKLKRPSVVTYPRTTLKWRN